MIALPADKHEMSVEISALGRRDQITDCISLAEADDNARLTCLVQVLNELQPASHTDFLLLATHRAVLRTCATI